MRAELREFANKVEDNRRIARDRLIEAIANLGDLAAPEAEIVADYYIKPKNRGGAGLMTFDPIMATFNIKHGMFFDRDVLRRALRIARERALPRQLAIPCRPESCMMSGRGDPHPLATSPMPCVIERVHGARGEYLRCLPPFYAYRLTEAGGHQYNVEIRLVPRDARRYYLGKRFERADETLAPPIVNVEEIL